MKDPELKIVMVCLGNICRSPMAEGILRKKIEAAGLPIMVDSAGTAEFHIGEAPDDRAIAAAKKRGINISGLRARQFMRSDFDRFDFIYVMDQSNYRDVCSLSRNEKDRNKVKLLLDFVEGETKKDVPDPWFGGPDGFFPVFDLIDQACSGLMKHLLSEQKK